MHAVLVIDPGVDPDAVVRAANAELDPGSGVRRRAGRSQGSVRRVKTMCGNEFAK